MSDQSAAGLQRYGYGYFPATLRSGKQAPTARRRYAALVGLNHYSTDYIRYQVQYPDLPGSPGVPWSPPAVGERPYQNLYLTPPRGATGGEYAQLITATADYIYADLIGSSAAVRDDKRTNISSQFVQRDYWGSPQ